MLIFANPSLIISLCILIIGILARTISARGKAELSKHSLILRSCTDLAIGGVLIFTLTRDIPCNIHAFQQWKLNPQGLIAWSSDGWTRLSLNPFNMEALLNFILFIPAGVFLTLRYRHPLTVLGVLITSSFCIECLQVTFNLGVNDISDLLTNTCGALAGVTFGSILIIISTRKINRSFIILFSLVLMSALLMHVGINYGANDRIRKLDEELSTRYRHTTLSTIHEWEEKGILADEVIEGNSVSSDSSIYRSNYIMFRFPAPFFFARQCIFARWGTSDFTTTKSYGEICDGVIQ